MVNAREFYDSRSEEYSRKWQSIESEDSFNAFYRNRLYDLVFSMASINSGDRVIEIGSGTGLTLRRLLSITRPVYGVDVSRAMLEQAKATTLADYKVAISDGEFPLDADALLRLGDFRTLDLPEASFDRILSVEVLRYIDDPTACFRVAYRALKPGGRLVFSATNLFSASTFPINHNIRRKLGRLDSDRQLLQYFSTTRGLRRQLQQCGFSVLGIEKLRFFSAHPIVKRRMRTSVGAARLYKFERRLLKIPLVNQFFDQLIVAAEKPF